MAIYHFLSIKIGSRGKGLHKVRLLLLHIGLARNSRTPKRD